MEGVNHMEDVNNIKRAQEKGQYKIALQVLGIGDRYAFVSYQ